MAAMIASVLAYEVFLPFFLLNAVLAALQARRAVRVGQRLVPTVVRLPVLLATTALVLLPVLLWKLYGDDTIRADIVDGRSPWRRW